MKKEDLYKAIGDIEDDLILQAEVPLKGGKKHLWGRLAVVAACFVMLLLVAVKEGGKEDILFQDKGVTVRYATAPNPVKLAESALAMFSEKQLLTTFHTVKFRGTVSQIENIEVDFQGDTAYRAIAEITVEQVYTGDIAAGQTISALVPCALNVEGQWAEDTAVISNFQVGREGIFMPMVLEDDTANWTQNNKTIDTRNIAPYSFPDGERFAFLATETGLVFAEDAYPSFQDATTLEDVEEILISYEAFTATTAPMDKKGAAQSQLEERLGQAITAMDQVQTGRVVVGEDGASAKVTVTLEVGARLSQEEVASIKKLVANALEGIGEEDVEIQHLSAFSS